MSDNFEKYRSAWEDLPATGKELEIETEGVLFQPETITAQEAAELSGLNEAHIRRMAIREAFPANKFGKSWAIPKKTFLKWVEDRPRVGRPPKE